MFGSDAVFEPMYLMVPLTTLCAAVPVKHFLPFLGTYVTQDRRVVVRSDSMTDHSDRSQAYRLNRRLGRQVSYQEQPSFRSKSFASVYLRYGN